jgi:carboxypeptidase D
MKFKQIKIFLLSGLFLFIVFISCSDGGGENAVYQYHTPEEINSFLDEIESVYPDIARVETVGRSQSDKYDIKALIISDHPGTLEGEPAIRLIGGIHGNEKMGIELLIRFIEYLTVNYGNVPTVTDLVNSRYICIIPVLNPDGLVNNSRYNSRGVDLNRNFNDSGNHWQSGASHGSSAFSESETQALRDYSLTKNFNISITYHVGAVLVNMPFDYGSELIDGIVPVENNLVKNVALAYTDSTNSMFLTNPNVFTRIYNSIYGDYINLDRGTINGGDWYYAYGSLQDWSYTQTGCLDLTIEVATGNPATEEGVQQIFMYNRDSLMAYIDKAGNGIYGRVTDGTNPINDVEVTVAGGDLIIKTDSNGYYNRILLPGTYDITFSKSGTTYTENNFSVSGRDNLDIQL